MDIKQKFERLQSQQKNSVFYPQDYTVAVFSGATDISAVQKALTNAGWTGDKVVPISGEEFLGWHRENQQNKDTLEKLQSLVAEVTGQETEYVKAFVVLAQQNHQFLIVHTPTPEDDQRMVEALKGFKPVKLSDYRPGSIADLEITQA